MKLDCKYLTEYLNRILPEAKCELNYNTDYQLLIAVMLSAQTTDKSVNEVTKVLFTQYPSLESLASADLFDIENAIKRLGLFRHKAQNIIAISKKLVAEFNGKVPSNKEELTTLPGVGNKTANVVRAELFQIPEIAVDTHIHRICKRLGIIKESEDVFTCEKHLRALFKKEQYILLHHQLIHFGRNICLARSPRCEECELKKYCLYYTKKSNS